MVQNGPKSSPKVVGRRVVLVDREDYQIGTTDLWQAHQHPGLLHRATSVLLHNGQGQVLLQRRSQYKPLWPLFWSNTYCTNTFPGETQTNCALRRGREELGLNLQANDLVEVFKLYYQADYNRKLSEHEVTTVLMGRCRGVITPNSEEVDQVRWVGWQQLLREIDQQPHIFTPWFKLMVLDHRIDGVFNRLG